MSPNQAYIVISSGITLLDAKKKKRNAYHVSTKAKAKLYLSLFVFVCVGVCVRFHATNVTNMM